MRKQLLAVFKEVMESDTIDETVSQTNCKTWDSLHHLNLIVELESVFGITIEPEDIDRMDDFSAVEKMLAGKIK